MKVGDKYICIKERYTFDKQIVNIPGNEYKILEIIKDINSLNIGVSCEYNIYHIVQWYRVCVDEEDKDNYWTFDEHFISLKEERKLKIEKINESR